MYNIWNAIYEDGGCIQNIYCGTEYIDTIAILILAWISHKADLGAIIVWWGLHCTAYIQTHTNTSHIQFMYK